MDMRNLLIAALLVVLAWMALDRRAEASSDVDSARGIIAVTGTYGSSASILYIFDTNTRHLACYASDSMRQLQFCAARDCSHDFLLETYRDNSPVTMLPRALRRSWKKYLDEGVPEDAGVTGPRPGVPVMPPAAPAEDGSPPGSRGAAPEGTGPPGAAPPKKAGGPAPERTKGGSAPDR
jgi:hypothetical protein